jgi:hypothetical protein
MTTSWPVGLTVAQVRIARPTDQLAQVEAFYAHHLGLSCSDLKITPGSAA